MLDLANVEAAIENALSLPNACYIDAALYQHEQDTVFQDSWVAFGFGKYVPQAGCVKPVNFAGLPLLLLRNQAGKINMFQNVCCHRGMILVDAVQQLRGPITCLYDSWAYDLDCGLRKTPHICGP